MDDGATWAILIAAKPGEATSVETQLLLARARSVAAAHNICAIIAEELSTDWVALAANVLPENRWSRRRGESTQAAITRNLGFLGRRDPHANLVLIPADHCAAEENAWVACAKDAVRLGVARDNTVFVLHDKLENDPRTSTNYPGVCSSSVIIGPIYSVRSLCADTPAISIVDLDVENSLPAMDMAQSAPLMVMHITSVEEYAKLQRGEYGRSRSRIDLHA